MKFEIVITLKTMTDRIWVRRLKRTNACTLKKQTEINQPRKKERKKVTAYSNLGDNREILHTIFIVANHSHLLRVSLIRSKFHSASLFHRNYFVEETDRENLGPFNIYSDIYPTTHNVHFLISSFSSINNPLP